MSCHVRAARMQRARADSTHSNAKGYAKRKGLSRPSGPNHVFSTAIEKCASISILLSLLLSQSVEVVSFHTGTHKHSRPALCGDSPEFY